MREGVLVTGVGATTPLGGDAPSTWSAMLAGKSGVRSLTQPWTRQLPARIAAPAAVEPEPLIGRVKARRMDRGEQFAVVAAREAWADAGLGGGGCDPERVAVVVGTGIGGAGSLLAHYSRFVSEGFRGSSPYAIPMLMPNGAAALIALDLGVTAGAHAPVSACASGAESIAWGMELIRGGRADVVIAGGAEAVIHPGTMAAFGILGAMSTRNDEPAAASRPFDRQRDGFVLGEGAAIVVLEREPHALARGVSGYARLSGAGMTCDGYDIVQPHPDGVGSARAIGIALRDAGVAPADIVHINAHATSTPTGDIAEVRAIGAAIGGHAVVSATKSMTGHLIGAAGALETIATVLAIRDGAAPPTLNLEDVDDGIELDITSGATRYLRIGVALNNASGFGGHNVALVFTAP